MRRLHFSWVLVLGACGGIDVPRSAPLVASGSGGQGTAGHPGAAVAGQAMVIMPSAGGSAGTPGIATGSGGFGVTPLPEYSRACLLERAMRGSAGAGGAPASEPAGTSASGGAGGEGGADLELGAGDLTLLVVFDKSGSMGDHWDERTKWEVANEALLKAVDPVIDNLTLGAVFFPQPGGCDVATLDSGTQIPFMTGRGFRSYWQETSGARLPDGSTPLERAFHIADMALVRGCELGLLDDRFRVVLVTDGEPTCEDDPARITGLAAEWSQAGVETWVMGLPGSDTALALLDSIAAAGGTEKAQVLGTPTQLDDGLATAAK